jgi:hypothetical protein
MQFIKTIGLIQSHSQVLLFHIPNPQSLHQAAHAVFEYRIMEEKLSSKRDSSIHWLSCRPPELPTAKQTHNTTTATTLTPDPTTEELDINRSTNDTFQLAG